MKKIYKYLIAFMIITIILVSIPTSKVLIDGYRRYKEVINEVSLQDKVDQIQKNDNYVSIENIDEDFLTGIVSVEDHRFYNHKGLDFIGIVRATINNIKEGKIVQGGSTITQQLAKNIYLNGNKNFSRKVTELFLAKDIERLFSKDEILEIYVNIINYGNGYMGIKEASKGYFDVNTNNLSFEEASMLAGLPQCPEGYNPKKHYERSIKRQQQVIAAIDKYGERNLLNQDYLLAVGYDLHAA